MRMGNMSAGGKQPPSPVERAIAKIMQAIGEADAGHLTGPKGKTVTVEITKGGAAGDDAETCKACMDGTCENPEHMGKDLEEIAAGMDQE